MTGEWLAHCAACPVPEIANVFHRARIPFHQITGMLENDPVCWHAVAEWVEAARVAHAMEHNRLGVMGHYYGGMLDIYTDLTQQCASFGGHVEIVEVDELAALRADVGDADVRARVAHFGQAFAVQPDCPQAELERAARTSVALDWLVERHRLGSLAYYYMGTGNAANEDAISSIILGTSLLTARGVPVAGEMEIKNVQAMKILDSFGAGGSFTEYYAMDYNDDVVLMGHDGPGHIAIAQGKTKVRPLKVYHGKVGRGLSVEMSVKHGPVTLLSVVEAAGGRTQALGGRRRIGARPDPGDRQHQQPLPVLHRREEIRRILERPGSRAPLRRRHRPRRRQDREARHAVADGSRESVLNRSVAEEAPSELTGCILSSSLSILARTARSGASRRIPWSMGRGFPEDFTANPGALRKPRQSAGSLRPATAALVVDGVAGPGGETDGPTPAGHPSCWTPAERRAASCG
jgi:hypothetical protein